MYTPDETPTPGPALNKAEARVELRQQVREIAGPVCEEHDCDLVAVHITGDRTGPVVRLFIDKAAGIRVEDCTRVSRALSAELDVEDPIPGKYRLEVSSPGIDRPVERVDDFRRFHGYQVKVKILPGRGRKRYTGRLAGVDGEHVLIDENANRAPHRVPLADIDRAQLVLTTEEFLRLGEQGLPPVEGGPE